LSAFQAALLAWSDAALRDLPWRHTRDPWAVLVSEVMLAQTQVARVVPKWQTFVRRWPDPRACARAPVAQVIAAWAGLGYNRRAVSLHRAATIITLRHEGRVPDSLAALTSLPGVGPYTARAVLAFAFEQSVGVVDTNAARVLARAATGRTLTSTEAQQEADHLVPPGRAWAWNQAMLDLGATLCRSRRPTCHACPLGADGPASGLCHWAQRGGPDPASGSAGTSRPQSTFVGSDRQGRGRLLATLTGPGCHRIGPDLLAIAAGWPHDLPRAGAAARGLVDDGLAEMLPDGSLCLPGHSGVGHTDGSAPFCVDRLSPIAGGE
jgi:A/G-specific adenine glycosylase